MQDATGQLDAMKQKYKKLEAQMMAKHNGQQLELKASMPGPREKRQKSELREPAQAVASVLFAPAAAPTSAPATTPTSAPAAAPTSAPAAAPTSAPAAVETELTAAPVAAMEEA